MDKMKNCKTCGAKIAVSAKNCPSCGAKNKPPVYKRVWFWLFMIFIVIPAVIGITQPNGTAKDTSSKDTATSSNPTVAFSESSVFDGDCGITASAEMGTNIIGYPTLTISIKNTSNKDISAIQFYAVPYNVYGEEITSWSASQRYLYTDDVIGAGQSDKLYYDPFIESSIKTMKLYVYSVYFSDGSEWGDKDATKSTILSKGAAIEVLGES